MLPGQGFWTSTGSLPEGRKHFCASPSNVRVPIAETGFQLRPLSLATDGKILGSRQAAQNLSCFPAAKMKNFLQNYLLFLCNQQYSTPKDEAEFAKCIAK